MFIRQQLINQLRASGVNDGDHLMIHASLRRIGKVDGGAAEIVRALDEAVGERGSLLMVLSAEGIGEWLSPPSEGEVAMLTNEQLFHKHRTPAMSEIGWLAEVFRTMDGTMVSDHPLGRFGARGRLAHDFIENVPWHDYYGPGSPLERLHNAGGRVLRLGANPDTVTMLHYAEYLAAIDAKRTVQRWVALAAGDDVTIRDVHSLDDSTGIVDWQGEDYFALLLKDYLRTGRAAHGQVGNATTELLDARDLVAFGTRWMEDHLGKDAVST